MSDSNKIDLKEVNKAKKQFKLPKITNPFKKQKGPKRDEEGKFAVKSGGGGLSAAKNVDLKRALPVILIVALVGGFFVFRSFASGSQATVTSWYRTCSNREPDAGGLAYWSGRLDKGEAVWTVADAFMKSAKVTSCNYPNVSKTAASPKAPVVPATKAAATTTGSTTSNPLNDAKAWSALGAAHVANAKKENDATYKISLKNPAIKNDLSLIAQKEGYVRGAVAQMQTGKGRVQGLYNQAISNAATKSQGPAILAEVNVVQGHINSLIGYIQNISADYKRAEATYEANLNFYQKLGDSQREAADCKARGGTPRWNGGCNEPPTPTKTGFGGSSTPAPGAGGTTTKAPIPSWMTAYQDQMAFAKGHCEKQPNKHKTVNIPGGYRVESYDVYYKKGSIECFEKYTHTISTHCGGGWSKSGTECVNAYAQAAEKAQNDCAKKVHHKWYNNSCKKVATTPSNAKCKGTAPSWSKWGFGSATTPGHYTYSAFYCIQGFVSMDCPAYYRENSWDNSGRRWHDCKLP